MNLISICHVACNLTLLISQGIPFVTLLSPINESGSCCLKCKAKISLATERELSSCGKSAPMGYTGCIRGFTPHSPGSTSAWEQAAQALGHRVLLPSFHNRWAFGPQLPAPPIVLGEWLPHKTSHESKSCKDSLDLILESQGTRMVNGWSLNLSRWF